MEVSILETRGFEGDLVLSVRGGTSRRQAPISTDQPFAFPCSMLNANPFKIDLMKPVAKKTVRIDPTKDIYSVLFATPDGKEHGLLTIQVKDVPAKCGVKGPPSRPGTANVPGSDWNLPLTDKEQTSERKQANAAAARKYLERFNLLSIVQEMLQHVIREKPEEPLLEMAKHLCRLSGHRTEPEAATKDDVLDGVLASVRSDDEAKIAADAAKLATDTAKIVADTLKFAENVCDAKKIVAEALKFAEEEGKAAVKLQSMHRGRGGRKVAAEKAKAAKDNAPGPPADPPPPPVPAPGPKPEPAKSVPDVAKELPPDDALVNNAAAVEEIPDQVVSLMMRQNERIDDQNETLRNEIRRLKKIVDDKDVPLSQAIGAVNLVDPAGGTPTNPSVEDLARREELASRNVELRREHEELRVQLSSFCSELSTIAGKLAATLEPRTGGPSAATAVYVEEHTAATNARIEGENRALARQIRGCQQDLATM